MTTRAESPTRSAGIENGVRTVAFGVIVAGSLAGVWILGKNYLPYARAFPAAAVVGIVVSLVGGAVGVWLLRRVLRPVRAPAWAGTWAALVWGAFAAVGIALLLNGLLGPAWSRTLGFETAGKWGAALTAPLNEEAAKIAGVFLLAAVSTRLVRGAADGLVFGALIGFGFQMMENVTYVFAAMGSAGGVDPMAATVESLATRVLVTGIGTHWTMSAIAGAGVGYLVSASTRSAARRVAVAVGCFVLAMAMHWFFDSPFLPGTGGAIAKTLLDFALVIIVYLIVRRRFRARWNTVSEEEVQAGSLTSDEAESLSRRRSRRRYLRGFKAGPPRRAQRRLQLAQLELLDERMPDGLAFDTARPWRDAVHRERSTS